MSVRKKNLITQTFARRTNQTHADWKSQSVLEVVRHASTSIASALYKRQHKTTIQTSEFERLHIAITACYVSWASPTRRMRSESLSFSEICNSRCVTQFAASFNDPRAKAFVVARDRLHRKRCNEVATSTRWTRRPYWKQGVSIWCVAGVKEHLCEWSFRRFTYGNLVTTSPSSRWLGLIKLSKRTVNDKYVINPKSLPNHPIGRSDGRCVQRAGT